LTLETLKFPYFFGASGFYCATIKNSKKNQNKPDFFEIMRTIMHADTPPAPTTTAANLPEKNTTTATVPTENGGKPDQKTEPVEPSDQVAEDDSSVS
jgi:hypothetical protein